ncbi:MAG TPA: M20 family metallopeptidase [Flexivirga sp.]|uniref:M20 metallopeptidase family protein n=1 Tax=Flexivirga sp. TaxID=1962927 RepID=UPI002BB3D3C1|nr:M20 family metallopeptidase [Flexivirga sp.]HWC22824.1 M20 family metallopeptidase [Flexivirga sp.]
MCDAKRIHAALHDELPAARRLRRRLHAQPDLSGQESATLATVLDALPAELRSIPVADTGATVRIGGPGPAVLLRAEMDALPVHEATGVDWASTRPGVMHACGHDVHVAAAVAVSRALHRMAAPVPLLLALQPREESYPSGALDIVRSGRLADEEVAAAVAAHLQPALAPGVVACVEGGVNASSDEFEVRVEGETGHAAYPHLTADPVLALAQVVVALQSVVSRSVDPMTPAVVGVSSIQAGSAANVVPGTARALGSLRALSTHTRRVLHERVVEVATAVASAHGCTAQVTFTDGEPVLTNDAALTRSTAARLAADGLEVCDTLRTLGADDFSYFSESVPSVMTFVGCETDRPLHGDAFLPSDADVDRVARAMLAAYLGAVDLLTERPRDVELVPPGTQTNFS